jgi:hypothetical protein
MPGRLIGAAVAALAVVVEPLRLFICFASRVGGRV